MRRRRVNVVLAAVGLVVLGLACGVFAGDESATEGQQPPGRAPTDAAAETEIEPELTEATGPELPAGFPTEFPLPSGGELIADFSSESEWNLLFSYSGSAAALAQEFRQGLSAADWTIDAEEVIEDEGVHSINLEFSGPEGSGRVLLIESEQGLGVEVRLSR